MPSACSHRHLQVSLFISDRQRGGRVAVRAMSVVMPHEARARAAPLPASGVEVDVVQPKLPPWHADMPREQAVRVSPLTMVLFVLWAFLCWQASHRGQVTFDHVVSHAEATRDYGT